MSTKASGFAGLALVWLSAAVAGPQAVQPAPQATHAVSGAAAARPAAGSASIGVRSASIGVRSASVGVRSAGTGVRSVSAGSGHACAIDIDGSLWCWGYNEFGQVGIGAVAASAPAPPARVSAQGTVWTKVSAGASHTCGLRDDHSLWCWGNNAYYELGDRLGNRSVPGPVGAGVTWSEISAGRLYTCGVLTDGALWCWGDQTAYGREPTAATWTSVGSGWDLTCGLRTDGTVWCWDGGAKQPPVRKGDGDDWSGLTVGSGQACALRADRTLWCWGDSWTGQVGDGTTTRREAPVRVGGESATWSSVEAGGGHTCGIRTDGSLWCWGGNWYGQLGDGTTTNRLTPVQVGDRTDWASVSAGSGFTCAVRTDATLWCWGDDLYGQLGSGQPARTAVSTPGQVELPA